MPNNHLTTLFQSHAHDTNAFLIAFGDFGLADINHSVGHIADVSELDYVYANQDALQTLMDDFESALRPKGELREKASKWLTSIGIPDNQLNKQLKKLSDAMENHRQAILLENAKYRQTQSQLQGIQDNMQSSLQSIDALLKNTTAQMTSKVQARVIERKTQIATQLTVVNQALQAVAISLAQNKEITDSMMEALSTGISASIVHDIVKKLNLNVSV